MVRLYTGPIVWQSGVVKRWLDSLMSYHSPLPGEVDSKSRWTDLDYLDTFWSNFLQTESLETDDRVDNVARQPSTSEKSLSSLDTASEEDQSSAGTESSTSLHPGDTPSVHLSTSLGDSPAPVVHPRASTRLGKRPAQTRHDSKSPPATKRVRLNRAVNSLPDSSTPRRSKRLQDLASRPPRAAQVEVTRKGPPSRTARKPRASTSARPTAPPAPRGGKARRGARRTSGSRR